MTTSDDVYTEYIDRLYARERATQRVLELICQERSLPRPIGVRVSTEHDNVHIQLGTRSAWLKWVHHLGGPNAEDAAVQEDKDDNGWKSVEHRWLTSDGVLVVRYLADFHYDGEPVDEPTDGDGEP